MHSAGNRKFDIVLLGATGFTGRLTAQYLAATAGKLRWALAGRNRDKLEAVQASLPCEGAQRPELVVADASDRASLEAPVGSTRGILFEVEPWPATQGGSE